VQDNTDFEFLLYHLGRQVDSAVGDPDGHPGGLTAVRGAQQAAIWRAALGGPRFASLPHRAGDDPNDPVSRFVAIAEAAARAAQPYAEDRLAAWCRLAHLPARAALRSFVDAAASPGNRRLALARRTGTRGRARACGISAHRCDEDFPYHRFFPAAWPTEAGADAGFVWPVLSRNQGLRDVRVALHIDQSDSDPVDGFVLLHVTLAAHAAQNGRIVSATPLASFGQSVPAEVARRSADIALDAHPFNVPEPRAGQHGEVMLLLRVEVRAPQAGEALITPTLRSGGAEAGPLILPTLRLAARGSGWTPIVADPMDENPARRQAVLRLNAPACLTHVAILPDGGAELRDSLRALVEAFLLPMTDTDLVAVIRTRKHHALDRNPGDGGVAGASQTVPVCDLLQGRLWPKLFQATRDLQSLQIEISALGGPHGLAGFSIQTSLRDADEAAGDEGATVAVALWVIGDAAALGLLRLDMVAVRNAFAAWVRQASPLQAWMADCTWVPEFDHYESYAMTLYEAAAAVDWRGRGLAGTLCGRAWPRRRLRFVAPHMWLGWELAGLVDTSRLAAVARVTAYADGVEVELRRPGDLAALERLLVPVLPLHV
jgi:hypothetical protein